MDNQTPPSARWTWDDRTHPRAMGAIDEPGDNGEWCDRLETAPTDCIVGKVLCVCVGSAIANDVLGAESENPERLAPARMSLELLERWTDDPTEERFEQICDLIFKQKQLSENFDSYGVTWWALRVATSSVGNYEAGWALRTVRSAAMMAGVTDQALRAIAKRELLSRLHRP
jgi:hypothetical protein